MATTQRFLPNHAIVHMGSQSKSEIKVEVHMSRETAERIVGIEGPPMGEGFEDRRSDPFEIRLADAVLTKLMLP